MYVLFSLKKISAFANNELETKFAVDTYNKMVVCYIYNTFSVLMNVTRSVSFVFRFRPCAGLEKTIIIIRPIKFYPKLFKNFLFPVFDFRSCRQCPLGLFILIRAKMTHLKFNQIQLLLVLRWCRPCSRAWVWSYNIKFNVFWSNVQGRKVK